MATTKCIWPSTAAALEKECTCIISRTVSFVRTPPQRVSTHRRKVKHFYFGQNLNVIFVNVSRTGTPPVPLRSTWQPGSAVWKSSSGCSPLAEGPRWRQTVELYLLITLQPVETSPV